MSFLQIISNKIFPTETLFRFQVIIISGIYKTRCRKYLKKITHRRKSQTRTCARAIVPACYLYMMAVHVIDRALFTILLSHTSVFDLGYQICDDIYWLYSNHMNNRACSPQAHIVQDVGLGAHLSICVPWCQSF
jgi:hypothetical protein